MKLRKYLLYALGEIVLVVIGILIALQINNWSNQQKMEAKEVAYLQDIRDNLIHDFKNLEDFIATMK